MPFSHPSHDADVYRQYAGQSLLGKQTPKTFTVVSGGSSVFGFLLTVLYTQSTYIGTGSLPRHLPGYSLTADKPERQSRREKEIEKKSLYPEVLGHEVLLCLDIGQTIEVPTFLWNANEPWRKSQLTQNFCLPRSLTSI